MVSEEDFREPYALIIRARKALSLLGAVGLEEQPDTSAAARRQAMPTRSAREL
jgi:hypothetical protein